jgi:hypothetical protein
MIQSSSMTPLFKKLNFKGQKEIAIFNAPPEFEKEMAAMKQDTTVKTAASDCRDAGFVISFVKTKKEIESFAGFLKNKLVGDPVIWFAYPKGTSKKYKVEINRDNGWESIQKLGFETVRAVSIDDDWSALRFRLSQFVGK